MAIFTAIASAIFGAGTFLAGATAFALKVAATFGLSMLARALAGEPTKRQIEQPGFSVQGTLQSGGVVPRQFPIGRCMTSGSLVYANTWGESGGTPNAYLTQVIALSDLPKISLVEVWVNGEQCTLLTGSPHAEYGYPVSEYRSGGVDYLWIKFHDGTQTTADSFLTSRVSSTERPWSSTRVGVGVAYAICTARVNDKLFTGFPSFKFVVDGIPLYDVSKDSTAGGSGSHRWSDPDTWGGDGDDLPAVQLYNVLRGITYGGAWQYGLQGLAEARLPFDNWIEQIGKCRETVQGPDGNEPRYRAGGMIVVSNEIGSTVEQLLSAMHGRLAEIGGTYKLYCGAPGSSVFAFDDDDILVTDEQTFTPFFGLHDTVNGIQARYPEPAEAWEYKSAPPLVRSDLEASDGGRRLMAEVSLDYVPYKRQVQHLMRSALQEARRFRRHTLALPPSAWVIEPGDIVSFTSARNGYASKQFRVDGVIDRANLDVVIDITEIDPTDYDWDQGSHYTAPVFGPVVLVRPPPQAIVDWSVSPTALYDADGLGRRPAILLSWDGNKDDIKGVEYQIRLAASGDVVVNGRTDDYAAGSVVVSHGILPETQYQARGRYVPERPRVTLWSDWLSVTTLPIYLTVVDFNAALRQYITTYISQQLAALNNATQQLASLTAQLASGKMDATEVITRITQASNDLTAAYTAAITAATGANSAIVQQLNTLAASISGVQSNLQTRFIVGATPSGALAAYELEATAQRAKAGLRLIAKSDGVGGALGQIWVDGDRFYVGKGSADTFRPLFVVDTTTNKVFLNGDLIAAGSITASHLRVATLSSISSNVGTIIAGMIKSPDGLVQFDVMNGRLVVYGS